jgi:hypothetical protein
VELLDRKAPLLPARELQSPVEDVPLDVDPAGRIGGGESCLGRDPGREV